MLKAKPKQPTPAAIRRKLLDTKSRPYPKRLFAYITVSGPFPGQRILLCIDGSTAMFRCVVNGVWWYGRYKGNAVDKPFSKETKDAYWEDHTEILPQALIASLAFEFGSSPTTTRRTS